MQNSPQSSHLVVLLQQPQQQQPQATATTTSARPQSDLYDPYLRRGTECFGRRWTTAFILQPAVVGMVIMVFGWGFLYWNLGENVGIVMICLGAMMSTWGCTLCCKARREWKALPPDHPERLKYKEPEEEEEHDVPDWTPLMPLVSKQLPAGAQIVMVPAGSSIGQVINYSAPGMSSGEPTTCISPSPFKTRVLISGGPSTCNTTSPTSRTTSVPSTDRWDEEPPPPYSDVVQ